MASLSMFDLKNWVFSFVLKMQSAPAARLFSAWFQIFRVMLMYPISAQYHKEAMKMNNIRDLRDSRIFMPL